MNQAEQDRRVDYIEFPTTGPERATVGTHVDLD
jgi:hypothetical protein